MTLKELYEYGIQNNSNVFKDVICDYLQKEDFYRSKYSFEDYLEELDVCPLCGEINERDNMTYHKWDVGEVEELVCESCREDETI